MSKKLIPRMRDVAARCGVAESTVSHVINGTKFVSPEIREKVLRVVRELNFHRDSHARRLALTHPPLTTVRMPRERLGGLALEILQEMLSKPTAAGRECVLGTELVIRESTGLAPDSSPQDGNRSISRSRGRR